MQRQPWQVEQSIDAVVFDCDSTLSQIEGIDQLAEKNGHLDKVQRLTEVAMSETGVFSSMYRERLDIVKPTRAQMFWLGEQYYASRTEHIIETIEILHHLKKPVYVASAGIRQAIKPFVKRLFIPSQNVYAVNVYFNEDGSYKDFEADSLLIEHKARVIAELKEKHPRIVHIGDGMNDVEAAHIATRFIGYGGDVYRRNVAKLSHFYVLCQSMLAVLPLLLTQQEAAALDKHYASCYQQGLALMKNGHIEGVD